MKSLHAFVVLAYKESQFLEKCIESVLNQKYHSNVIIATTTPNEYIRNIAKKHSLKVVVGKHTNIGGDFDFALSVGKSELVTIAHQDDMYDYEYSAKIVEYYKKYKNDTSILFTDYYEIRNGKRVESNTNLKIKRILLSPLKNHKNRLKVRKKRSVLKFGNSISCPSVTFVKRNCPNMVFESDFKTNVDWLAWTRLASLPNGFVYISDGKLMGHRISEESTTTDLIKSGIRAKEDYEMYSMFWPGFIAKMLSGIYKNSEKSNKLKE